MRYSVRLKLFLGISGLIVFYVLASWLLNNQFLDQYYYYIKKNMLMDSYRTISNLYKGDPAEISLELEKLARTSGLHIIIVGKNFEMKYNSIGDIWRLRQRPQNRNTQQDENLFPENLIKLKAKYIYSGEIIFEKTKEPRLKSDFLNLLTLLGNGDYLYIGMALMPISENAKIANTFFLFTGIATIITGSILVFIFSRRFTKPILELNEIAQRMEKLDFGKRYKIRTQDEIGELGKSINSLSGQLEKSISELREANEKLIKDIEQKQKIDEMRKEFISSVSHELKTPIALVQGYAEGLKVNVNEDEENKNFYCDVIMDEAVKMNRLVKQLLDLSQMESGSADIERESFNVFPLIDQVLKKNALIFREKGISVIFEKSSDIIVNADINRVEQILNNYISNAVNHLDQRKIIEISIAKHENKARISVVNSGKHIPEECLDQIWKSFYKIDKARTRAYGGTGLGLSIVRAIQEAQGCGYGVNNVEDGVEFWFELDIDFHNNS